MSPLKTRPEWGAKTVSRSPMPTKPAKEAYLHHTASEPTADEAKSMRLLEQSQIASGYLTIAYHEVGFDSGNVYEGRGVQYLGGATKNKNSTSLAYVLYGNFVNRQPTAAALETCAQRLAQWVRDGRLTPDFVLRPHSDVFATACPGTNLKNKISSIRARVTEILKGGSVSTDALTAEEFNYIHILAYGGLPGSGYDGRYTGQGLTATLHAMLGPDPLGEKAQTLAANVKRKELIKPSECPKTEVPAPGPTECKCSCDPEAIAEAVFQRNKKQVNK